MTGSRKTLGLVVRAVQVRLRFVAVLAVAFLVVGRWDDLRNHWGRLTRAAGAGASAQPSVSSDTEYFCPMDPGVLSDWPGKCGICNMGLVRRKKGDASPLPSGVVARMQVSPYRVQLAGVRTSVVEYQPLEIAAVLVGKANADGSVSAEPLGRDVPWLAEGLKATVIREDRSALPARVTKVDTSGRTVRLAVDDPDRTIKPGESVTSRVRRPVAEVEPFRSLPSDPPPVRKGEPRTVHVCPEHPETPRDKAGKCPVDGKDALEPLPLLANQRLGWWCPMHPKVTADAPGSKCEACGGMVLTPRVVTYRPKGQVLAMPESAVVDTGTRKVVYVESMPGMFDGIEVVLGPRCGDVYPVVSGLEPGRRVATAGAFLIDAETRLNPSLAAAYFGAGRRSEAKPPADDPLVVAQKVCPVTGKALGSMGTPVRVTVAGRTVLLCCEGCRGAIEKSPEKYLPKLP